MLQKPVRHIPLHRHGAQAAVGPDVAERADWRGRGARPRQRGSGTGRLGGRAAPAARLQRGVHLAYRVKRARFGDRRRANAPSE